MKAFLFILISFAFVHYSNAQNETKEFSPEQTASSFRQVEAYIKESRSFINTDRAKAKSFANKALQLARLKKNSYWMAKSLLAKADAERFTDDIVTLLTDERNAVSYAGKTNNDTLLFDCLNTCALDLITLTHFDEAAALIEEEKKLPADFYNHPDNKARLLNTQGYFILRQQKSMTEAKELLNQSLVIANKTGNVYLTAKNKLFLFRAMLLSGAHDSTSNYIFDALNTFQKNGYPEDEANCDIELSNSYRFLADLNKSSEYAQSGYELMALHQNHLGAGAALSILFQNYYFQKQLDKAKKDVDLMNEHYTKLNFENGIGTTEMCFGAWYSANGEYTKADTAFKRADEIADRLKLSPLKAALSMFKSVHYQAQNKQKEADSAALQGYALTQKSLPNELLKKMYSSKDSAKLSRGQELDKRLFNDSIFREQHGREALQSIREDNGGEQIYKPVLSVFDSGLNSAYNRQLTELETKYKTRQKDDSLLIAKQKSIADAATIQKQNLFITSVVIFALLLTAGFFLQYKNRRRAEQDKARIQSDKEKIEMLQNEIHHRVKNNLGVINRLIEVAGRGGADNVSLQTLRTRVKAIELLHKRLYNDNLTGHVSLQEYLLDLTAAIRDMFEDEKKEITISVDAPVEVSGKTAEKIGLIINELITNSYKYAFDEKQYGSINIEARSTEAYEYRLVVSDNGKGFTGSQKKNYGMKLIAGLSHELGGSYAYANGAGTQFNLTFKDNA